MADKHSFCRYSLKEQMREVRKHFAGDQIRKAWAWSDGSGNFEFHGPNGEYFDNLTMADCSWSAKAEGWRRVIDKLNERKEED